LRVYSEKIISRNVDILNGSEMWDEKERAKPAEWKQCDKYQEIFTE